VQLSGNVVDGFRSSRCSPSGVEHGVSIILDRLRNHLAKLICILLNM